MITPNEKYFEYENNGIKGKIILILESSDKINIKIIDNNINYQSIFNLKNLKKKNKHFQLYNISEIYEILSKYIENKNYILEKTANGIILKIPIENFFTTTEAEFEIINETQNKDDLIQKLLNEKKDIKSQLNIIQLEQREMKEEQKQIKEEQREMKEEQKQIKDKLDKILEILNKLINNNNNDNNKIKENKEIINKEIINNNLNDFENIMKKSKIIDKNNNQISYIKNWISPNKNIKCKLIYDGKRDGGQISIFHSFCDNKGPTITFIKTNNKRRIGGFTMKNWDINKNSYISDDKAFIFDLDLNEKYDINKKENAIYTWKGYGPSFGGYFDIYIGENFLSDEKTSYFYHKDNTYYNYSSNIKNHNQTYFICEEIEVYQIIFDN